jgi:hypothetical protein
MTICERCGTARQFIPEACPSCGFRPQALRELAIAALLTDQFEAGNEDWGTEPAALEELARAICGGTPPVWDEAEVIRHETAVKGFLEEGPVPPLPVALFIMFRPAIVFIGVLLLIWLALRFFLR